jgi:hypothetical protein
MTDADLELFTAEMPDLMATIAQDVDFRWVHEGILITDIIQHRETLKVILKSLCDDMCDEIVTVTAPSRPPGQTRLCLPKKVSCKVPVLLQLRKHVANQSEWANLSCRLSQELRELRSENMGMLQAKTLALTQEQHGVHTAGPKHLNADRPLDIQHLANIAVHIKMLEILQWSIEMLPVLPLDGGRILQTLLGPRRIKLTLMISMAVAVGVGLLYFSKTGDPLLPIFMAMFAYQSFQALKTLP